MTKYRPIGPILQLQQGGSRQKRPNYSLRSIKTVIGGGVNGRGGDGRTQDVEECSRWYKTSDGAS